MLSLLVALIIFGVVLYLINLIPMQPIVKQVIMVIAIAFVVIWALQLLLGGGVFPALHLSR